MLLWIFYSWMCTNPNILCLWFQPLQPPPPPLTLKTCCTNFSSGIGEHVTTMCVFPFHCSSHGILKTWQHDPQENLILENLILVVAVLQNQLVVVMVVVGTHTERLTRRLLVEHVQKRASSHATIYSPTRGGSTRSLRTLYGTQHLREQITFRD